VEVVSARLSARAKVPQDARTASVILRQAQDDVRQSQDDTRPGRRRVWLDGAFSDVPVFARGSLVDGRRVDGPAILEEYDSTTFLAPQWSLHPKDELLVLQSKRR
jgi:N-methylhydantoinase A